MIVIVLLSALTNLLSWLMLFPSMFDSISSLMTYAKCIVATTMASAVLTVDMDIYLCLKNTVSVMKMLCVSFTHTL